MITCFIFLGFFVLGIYQPIQSMEQQDMEDEGASEMVDETNEKDETQKIQKRKYAAILNILEKDKGKKSKNFDTKTDMREIARERYAGIQDHECLYCTFDDHAFNYKCPFHGGPGKNK